MTLYSEGGFSLVEVLVGAAISTMVIAIAFALLWSTMTSQRVLSKKTDAYEAVRVPAALITQDARTAYRIACGFGDYLQLALNSTGTNYVIYQFADETGTPDPNNLHRVAVSGGAVQSANIVGWNLVSDQGQPDFTSFGCNLDPIRHITTATAHLVRQPIAANKPSIALDVVATPRS